MEKILEKCYVWNGKVLRLVFLIILNEFHLAFESYYLITFK